MLSRIGAAVVALAYVAALVLAEHVSPLGFLGIGAVLALAVEGLRRTVATDTVALALAIAPLHLLVIGTGGLASPALPLAAAWVVGLGLLNARAAPVAAAVLGALVLGAEYLHHGVPDGLDAARLAVLLVLAAALPVLVRGMAGANGSSRGGARRHVGDLQPSPDGSVRALLEVVRDATRAREAALWFHDRDRELLVPIDRATAAGAAFAAPGVVARVDEHPYGWALNEKQPVHLQKGKNPLPREFAVEMLLLPLHDTGGLLVLSFDEPVPGGAQAVALACSRLLAGLDGILPTTDQPTHEVRDALTGLATPEAFEAHLDGLAAHFRRYQRPFALVVLDIDHFKATNDRWGHGAGDRLLQHIAMLLRGSLRETDYAGRIGGEEFGVLLPETALDEALALAERVRTTVVENPLAWSGSRIAATASFGVATCPGSTVLPTEIRAEADAALLRAKRGGRNRVASAEPDA